MQLSVPTLHSHSLPQSILWFPFPNCLCFTFTPVLRDVMMEDKAANGLQNREATVLFQARQESAIPEWWRLRFKANFYSSTTSAARCLQPGKIRPQGRTLKSIFISKGMRHWNPHSCSLRWAQPLRGIPWWAHLPITPLKLTTVLHSDPTTLAWVKTV